MVYNLIIPPRISTKRTIVPSPQVIVVA